MKQGLLSVTALCWAIMVSVAIGLGADLPDQPAPSPIPVSAVAATKSLLLAPAIQQVPVIANAVSQDAQTVMLDVKFIERTLPRASTRSEPPNESQGLSENSVPAVPKELDDATRGEILEPAELTKTLADFRSNSQYKFIAEPSLRLRLGIPGRYLSGYEVFPKANVGETEPEPENSQVSPTPLFIGMSVTSTVTSVQPGLLNLVLDVSHTTEHGAISPATGYPGCQSRRVSTQIFMKDGQTLLLRGLKAHQKIQQISRVPVLGNLPFFGEKLFTDRTTEVVETELIMMATLSIEDDSPN